MTDRFFEDPPGQLPTHRGHIRQSSLMLLGRLVAVVLNLVVQVVTVRYLTRSDYGSFAYVIALVSFGTSFILLGQNLALGRLLPIYEETGRPTHARGSMVVAFASVFLLGASTIAIVMGLQFVADVELIDDGTARSLLVILIALAPIQAFDALLMEISAVTGKASIIFVRRFLLTPALRLASVLFVVSVSAPVTTLAWAYLLSGVVGLAAYVVMLRRVLRHRWAASDPRVVPPVREMLSFGLPMFASEVVRALQAASVIVIIEALRTVEDVAGYRAVLPIAHLNIIALESFGRLYLPRVSRLLARGEQDELGRLYWESTIWIAVVAFPVFAMSFCFARPTTILVFGDRYESSAAILAVLAVGHYFSASLGPNVLTLNGAGRVRVMLTIDVTVVAFSIAAMLLLVPRHGALGAALSVAGSLVLRNVLAQLALRSTTGQARVPRHARKVYLVITSTALVLTMTQAAIAPSTVVALGLAAAGSLVVFFACRDALRVADTFPEVLRIPLLGRLVE